MRAGADLWTYVHECSGFWSMRTGADLWTYVHECSSFWIVTMVLKCRHNTQNRSKEKGEQATEVVAKSLAEKRGVHDVYNIVAVGFATIVATFVETLRWHGTAMLEIKYHDSMGLLCLPLNVRAHQLDVDLSSIIFRYDQELLLGGIENQRLSLSGLFPKANDITPLSAIDVAETFSPVVKPAAIQTVLSLATSRQSARSQECLLTWTTAYLLLYVDDIVLTASSEVLLQQIISSLHQEFSITVLGSLNYFLSIFVVCDSLSMFLPQRKYAAEIYERTHMVHCNPVLHVLFRILPLLTRIFLLQYNSVVYLSSNPVQHQRTKHIEIDIHFVRDLVVVGQVQILHVLSRYQYADIFTKSLSSALFEEFRTSLSICCHPVQTTEEC
uniref:Ribonuclease H-like domain-containing protein n=1 Tax=Tanacetum cinerariifolium TaxID=118510 RepID=A0A6L2L163_TANCI|nr:ribonuclease H-like domain-containing protein [Tanacetum cinerariifolium]